MPKQAEHVIEKIEITPWFDMETYMILSKSKRLDAATAQIIDESWERWHPHLHVRSIKVKKNGYVLMWLDEIVEKEVNATWDSSPSRAYTLNSLAQSILMATVRELIPQVQGNNCAPVPKPTPGLKAALEEIGLPWTEHATLARQFAMLTYYPYSKGCEVCFLKDECPKTTIGDPIATYKE